MADTKKLNSPLPAPFIFSQSSLQDYSDCERRFYLRYIEKLAWPAVESEPVLEYEARMIEGQLFHRLIHQYWLGLPIDKLTKMANTPNLIQWWHNFIDYDFNIKQHKMFPELFLNSQIGNHRLIAKYDLVAIKEDKITIFDWKTYTRKPREDKLARTYQTRVYRSLLVQAGGFLTEKGTMIPEWVEMVYWLANYPSQPIRFDYKSAQFKRDWQHLDVLISRIESQDEFPMTSDEKKCSYCLYRSYCDRGISASPYDEEFESNLEVSDLTFDNISEIEL